MYQECYNTLPQFGADGGQAWLMAKAFMLSRGLVYVKKKINMDLEETLEVEGLYLPRVPLKSASQGPFQGHMGVPPALLTILIPPHGEG